MNEMLERMTAALISEWGKGNSAKLGEGDPSTDYFLEQAPNFARAVLKAMRKPTEAMILASAMAEAEQHYYKANAWNRCVDDERKQDYLNGARLGHEAAIDAVLGRRVFKVEATYDLPKGLSKPGRLPNVYAGPCPFRWNKDDGLAAWEGGWRLDGAGIEGARTFKVTAVDSYCLQVIGEGSNVGLLVEEAEP